MMLDPMPDRVAATITRLDIVATAPLNAYWLCLTGDRNAYAENLQQLVGDCGLVVLIVRQEGFDNPNALMVDLVHLLERNKPVFLSALARPRPDPGRIGIILLARRELAMGQGTSPAIWPEWVPNVGGRETTCFITDVTRSIEVPLDAEEIDVGRVHGALYAIERALLRRLISVDSWRPTAHHALFSAIKRKTDAAWLSFLAGAMREADKVEAIQSYRPSTKSAESLVSRLWNVNQNRTPREVVVVGSALAAALDIVPDDLVGDSWEGLPTVLARWPRQALPRADQFCRHMILTVSTACQYITCAAHSDHYRKYPVNLLVSVLDDLYRALVDIETSVNRLVDGPGKQVSTVRLGER